MAEFLWLPLLQNICRIQLCNSQRDVMFVSGVIIWTTNISHSIGMPGTFARASTVVADEYLLVGVYNPAIVVALYRFNGTLAWNKTVDEDPYAQVTMAGTPFNG